MRRKPTRQGYPSFPRTLGEFQRRFATEGACLTYLARVRWPDGFECPRCQARRAWVIRRRVYRCRGCRKEVSVTAGTVLHRTHLPVRAWFWAAYLMSTLTPGISALQLQKQLGLGSYEAAWYLTRRLRRAMVNPDRDPLVGVVEVDEMYVGNLPPGYTGRSPEGRTIVAVAVESRGDHAGRVRMQIVPDVSEPTLVGFVRRVVAPGSQVNTDGWRAYGGLDPTRYRHRPRVQGRPARAGIILPWVHRVIGNFKTWLRGTHHGRVESHHLQAYLDEFTFRFNRRRVREHAFLTLLILATRWKPFQPSSPRSVASTG